MSDAWVKFAAAVEKVEAGVLTRHADAQVIRLSTSNFVDESPSATVNKASDKMVDWMSVGAINKPSVSTGEGRQDLITSIRAMTADAPSASSPSAAEALDHAKVSQAKRKIAVKFVNWTQIDPLEANARWQVNLAVMPQQDVGVSKNYEEALFRLASEYHRLQKFTRHVHARRWCQTQSRRSEAFAPPRCCGKDSIFHGAA